MIKIVHADDHPIVRAGLSLMLSSTQEFSLVGQGSDGEEALALVEAHRPDVALLDLSMPNLGGLRACPRIREISPNTKIIILSVHEGRHYAVRALRAGADGYMHKGAGENAIPEAIRKVHEGRRAMPLHLLDLETAEIPSTDCLRLLELSRREQEVFYLLAECKTSHEAASELGVNVKTVDSHRHKIMRKMGFRGNADLTRFAIQEGLIEA